jgi:hypothetical protein
MTSASHSPRPVLGAIAVAWLAPSVALATSPPGTPQPQPASPETRRLVALSGASAQKLVAADPEDPTVWREVADAGLAPLEIDGWTYSLKTDGSLVATMGGEVRWQVAARSAPGATFAMRLSANGNVLVRDCSTGRSDAYDAHTGLNFGRLGPAFGNLVDPEDRFLLCVVGINDPRDPPKRTEIQFVPTGPVGAERKRVASLDVDPSQVHLAINRTGDLFAYSTPKELVIFRTADHVKIATSPKPPAGSLAFTRSGTALVVRDPSKRSLLNVYRLEP